MRLVAGMLVAALVVAAFDHAMYGGRFRTGVTSMVKHMTNVTWRH